MEFDRGGDAGDRAFRKGPAHPAQGGIPVDPPDDQLADQGVVEGRDLVAGVDVAVDPHPGPAGGKPAGDLARRRSEVVARILGIDPALDRMAGEADLVLAHRDRFTAGDAQLLGDQVDPGHHLGDRVFDLNAGVHLHEVEAAAAIHQELHGAGALVADAACRSHGGGSHPFTQLWIQPRAGGLLQQLLVPALDRAVALPQVHHVAVAVGQHLHFHVAGPVDEFLHVEARVAEGGFGFALGGLEQVVELVGGRDQPHPPAAAACGGLDHHRVAHLCGEGCCRGGVRQQAFATWDGGDPHLLHRGLGGGLVAHGPDRFRGGAHKGDAVVLADLGEAIVFGQKAVARMDRIGAAGGGGGEDVGNIEIASAAGGFPHADGLVGQLHVQRVAVHGAVHGHRGDAQFAAAAQDAQGDFATVGDQQLADGHPGRGRGGKTLEPDCISVAVSARPADLAPLWAGWSGGWVYCSAVSGSTLAPTRNNQPRLVRPIPADVVELVDTHV